MSDDAGQGSVQASSPLGRERRTSMRVPLEMWVEEIGQDSLVYRRAGNLSRGGMYLDKTIPIPMGTQVNLRFTLPGDIHPLVLKGEVVSIDPQSELGMGVKFLEVDEGARKQIDYFLERTLTPLAVG